MSWTVTAGSGQGGSEKAPAGNHPAVLVGLIDLGDQWQDPFDKTQEGRYERRIYFVWELVTKRKTGMDANHLIAIDLKLSFHEKAKMRQWVEARTGRKVPDGTQYDIVQELGQPVLLSVVEKNGYPRVNGVSGIPDGLTVPPPKTKPVAWKLDPARLDDIPDWVPYLYGQPIPDVVRGCRQIAGDRAKQPVGAGAGSGSGFQPPADDGGDVPF